MSHQNTLEDLDIFWHAIAQGDAQSFGRWMLSAEPILRESLRRFASYVDTEAVLQETLLRVWQVAPKVELDGKGNSLLRLGIRIARNLSISEIRKSSRMELTDFQAPEQQRFVSSAGISSEDEMPDYILRKFINDCRSELPEKPRMALEARLASSGGSSDAELAKGLRMRKNTFLQNITRARKFLSNCLEKYGIHWSKGTA